MQEDATRLTLRKSGHNRVILNPGVVEQYIQHGSENLAGASRFFNANLEQFLEFIFTA